MALLIETEKPDAVHILTPPGAHAPLAIQAMEAGCHVLVEKPMTVSSADAERMVAVAKEHNVKLCVNHNYLFKPSVAQAREMVNNGEIGDVVSVNCYYGRSEVGNTAASQAHWARRLPGGPFTDFLPHIIYLQLAFLGDIHSVPGVTISPVGAGEKATEMNALFQGSKASGSMSVSMMAQPYAKFVEIYGTKGIIHADLVREVCSVHRKRRLPGMLSKALYNLEDSVQLASGTVASTAKVALRKMKSMPGLRVLTQGFYDSIRNNSQPPVTGEDGLKNHANYGADVGASETSRGD